MKRRIGAIALALLLAMAALWGLRAVSRSMMFPRADTPLPSERELARDGLRLLECRTSDGLSLRCAYRPARSAELPVIVYFHGNAESAAQNLDLVPALAHHGWGVLLAEYRGYGGLAGSPTEEALYADGLAALDALRQESPAAHRVVLVGRSLGTGVAVELARRGRGDALVLISPYTSMVALGRLLVGPLARLAVADLFDNAAKAPDLRQPVVIIHGARDEVVPFEMGVTLARLLPRARLVALPDVGHNDLPDLPGLIVREVTALMEAQG
jgi:fermentation-respiration switch protein FrsA (DUF1100 family)